ncbi:hypothetical protein COCSADRAFT_35345 [Bipolaris sorokiniana ND90Pr]|uniref:Uncharacterized protein n=1 Tax=Cochliobolus sativus (strain ND90Pr / ATCC 201652) TaxID=665912 RepID=M2SSJ8_COCSN|nr:uncharacterized protein COCSADRAFT_35345 [Bipolaris sorokiniana ND90Pr]EMD65265.1 hypothetical protein COCSADRAFT_35345 [Bipolaris sorokiniana ND90Pr]
MLMRLVILSAIAAVVSADSLCWYNSGSNAALTIGCCTSGSCPSSHRGATFRGSLQANDCSSAGRC